MKMQFAALLVLALLAGPVAAHKDQMLQVMKDGSIPDVPAKFGRVTLIVDGLGLENPLIQLRIGGRHTTLPTCVSRLVSSRKPEQIEVTGSWYHSEKVMPYYLTIRFFSQGYDPKTSTYFQPHQDFIFNLHDANLIDSRRFKVVVNGGEYLDLELPAGCKLKSRS